MEQTHENPFNPFSWIALPIKGLSWIVTQVRARLYDPEKITCPACGFRGDSGTNGKTCSIKFVRTMGNERAAIQHTCFRCGCNEIFSHVYAPAGMWLPKVEDRKVAEAKAIVANTEI